VEQIQTASRISPHGLTIENEKRGGKKKKRAKLRRFEEVTGGTNTGLHLSGGIWLEGRREVGGAEPKIPGYFCSPADNSSSLSGEDGGGSKPVEHGNQDLGGV